MVSATLTVVGTVMTVVVVVVVEATVVELGSEGLVRLVVVLVRRVEDLVVVGTSDGLSSISEV